MSSVYSDRRVCVLDASGYVGFWLVRALLLKGWTVHAAITRPCSASSLEESDALRRLNELERSSNESLRVFSVDVLDYHSLTDAFGCCSALFYTFDACQIQIGDGMPAYNEAMAEIEVRGAHNVLEASAQIDTIDKIIFTSSVSALIWKDEPRNSGSASSSSAHSIDERSWSDPNYCRKLKLWHAVGKTLAEKTAWALAMDRGLNMVSVNVPLIVGPAFSQFNPAPTLSFLKGAAEMYEDGVLATVDVRFLAEVQLCLLDESEAYGRYICYDRVINSAETAVALARALKPLLTLPERWEDENIHAERLCNKKLKDLLLQRNSRANKSRGCIFKAPPKASLLQI